MINLSGRRLAQLVLDQIEMEAAYTNQALNRVLRQQSPPSPRRENALATELVYGVMRHLLKLDYLLGRLLSRPLKTLKTPVKNILRLSLYQLLYLPDIPERAVCHSAVELVKDSPYRGLAELVNGVLRSYLRQRSELTGPERSADLQQYLALEYSHPAWMVQRWLERFGPDRTEAILQVNQEPAPLTVRVNQCRATAAELQTELEAAGVMAQPGLLLKEALVLKNLPGPFEELGPFQAGRLTPQDETAMLISHLVAPVSGERLLDLCAAPGGKSTHLAELMGDRGLVVSLDQYQHKIDLITLNAARLGLKSIQPRLGDARTYRPEDGGLFDAVLVDAPCSGSGVWRRRVDGRYRLQPSDLPGLVVLQRAILKNAAGLVRPGGRLVYATCSLETEENQQQLEWLVREFPEFKIERWRDYLPAPLSNFLENPAEPWVTVLPIAGGGDGFFGGRLIKHG